MTVADKEETWSLIQSITEGWVLEWFLLNWALCYKIEELFDLEEGSPTFCARKTSFHTIIPAFVTKDQNPYEFWSNGRRLSTTRTRTNL
jgi:gamma-glutamyltranspeptidase/glutathione hydrolase